MNSRDIPIDEILADAGWLRALAGSLVADDATADEVAQDALIAAWRSPPKDDRPARAWLTTVVRNLTRKAHRSDVRRRSREAAAARPEVDSLPGPDELLARLESVRRVGEHVAELDEPYRMTVILRFYEGLDSAEIARRLDVPAGTVRWRLKTALDSLRERMDDDHDGARTAWVALLLPIAGPPPAGTPPPTAGSGAGTAAATAAGVGGVLAVKKLIAVLAVFALGVVGLHLTGVLAPASPETPEAAPRAELPPPTGPSADDAAGPPVVSIGRHPHTRHADLAGASEAVVRLRVIDEEDRAIENAVLILSGPNEPVKAGPDGRVLIRYPLTQKSESMRIEIRAAGFAEKTLRIGVQRSESVDLGDVRLEAAGAIVGVVLGHDGLPFRGARVRAARATGNLDFDSDHRVTGPVGTTGHALTGADGTFRLTGLPFGRWRAWAGAENMRWSVSEPVTVVRDGEAPSVRLTLKPLDPAELFSGRVLDPDGNPVPRAMVRYRVVKADGGFVHSGSFSAEPDGTFRFRNRGGERGTFSARDREEKFGEARVEDHVAGSGEVVLRLTAAKRMVIVATTPDGAPVATFAVTLRDRDDRDSLADATGKEGRVDLVLPATEFRVRVSAEGCRNEARGPFTPDNAPEELAVVLTPLPGIRGQVLAEGRPIPEARVVVHALADPRWHKEVDDFIVTLDADTQAEGTTGPDGTFRVTPKRGERLLVRASFAGFAPAESEPFEYDPERGLKGVTIRLTPGGTIEGRVLGDAPNGTIVGISRGDTYGLTVRVGPDGKYRFGRLTPGPWLVVIREKEILPPQRSEFVGGRRVPIRFNCQVREGETTKFDLDPPAPPAVVIGRLLVNGQAPEGWRASLHRKGGGLVALVRRDLDAAGRFRLPTVTGRYRLLVTSPDRLLAGTTVVFDLDVAGETRQEIAWTTGALDNAPAAEEGTKLLHRWRSPAGWFVLTSVPAAGGRIEVPTGAGDIVRFDLKRWSKPAEWPTVRSVTVR